MCHNIQDLPIFCNNVLFTESSATIGYKKNYSEGNIFSDIKLFVFSQWFQTTSHNSKTLGEEMEMNYSLS